MRILQKKFTNFHFHFYISLELKYKMCEKINRKYFTKTQRMAVEFRISVFSDITKGTDTKLQIMFEHIIVLPRFKSIYLKFILFNLFLKTY